MKTFLYVTYAAVVTFAAAESQPPTFTNVPTHTDYTHLYNNMTTTYHPMTRPLMDQSQPLTIYIDFHLISLLGVDEVCVGRGLYIINLYCHVLQIHTNRFTK